MLPLASNVWKGRAARFDLDGGMLYDLVSDKTKCAFSGNSQCLQIIGQGGVMKAVDFGFFRNLVRYVIISVILLVSSALFLGTLGVQQALSKPNSNIPANSLMANTDQSAIVSLIPGSDAPPLYSYIRYRTVPLGTDDPMPYVQTDAEFDHLERESFVFGPVGSRTLVLISVRNDGDIEGNWVLTTHRGLFKNFSISDISGQKSRLIIDSNNIEQTAQALRTKHFFTDELMLQPGEEKQIAILFDSIHLPVLPFEIVTAETFADNTYLLLAIVIGSSVGILAIAIISVSIYAATGRPEFFWAGLAELAAILEIVLMGGFFGIYLLYDNVELVFILGFLIPLLFSIAMSQFARSFIKTRKNSPLLDRILASIIFVGLLTALALVAAAFFPNLMLSEISMPMAGLVVLASTFVLPYVAIIATRRLGTYYWPLIIAWGVVSIFRIATMAVSFDFIPQIPFSYFIHGPIGLFNTVFSFLALLLFLNSLNRERLNNALHLNESLIAQQKIGEKANKLTLQNEDAMSTIRDQENLIHASGHDSQHVLMALKTIIKFADEFGSDKLQEKLPDMLKSSASHLEDIIGTTMSNPVAGFQSASFVALSSFNAADFSHSLETIYAPMMRKEGMNLRLESEDDLMLVSDRALLARVLSNLLSNCMKYAKGSDVTISTRSNDDLVYITVADGGTGIPEQVIERISTTSAMRVVSSDLETGTGFGLLSSKRIIATLGGTIDIEKSAEGGAAITVALPHLVKEKAEEAISTQKIQSQLDAYQIIDVDAFDEMGVATDRELQEAVDKNVLILPISVDNSSQTAGRISKFAALMLLKPVTLSMTNHPLLSEIAQHHRENQEKEGDTTMAKGEPS